MHLNKQLHILFSIGSSDRNTAAIWYQINGCHFSEAFVLHLHATTKHVFHVSVELHSRKRQQQQHHEYLRQSPEAYISSHVRELTLSAPNQTCQPEAMCASELIVFGELAKTARIHRLTNELFINNQGEMNIKNNAIVYG